MFISEGPNRLSPKAPKEAPTDADIQREGHAMMSGNTEIVASEHHLMACMARRFRRFDRAGIRPMAKRGSAPDTIMYVRELTTL